MLLPLLMDATTTLLLPPLFLLLSLIAIMDSALSISPLSFTIPSPLDLPNRNPLQALRFHGPSFKIALFADLHYGEDAWEDWGPSQDRNSTRVMSFILDVEKPDFVIFLGDLLTANNLPSANATNYWDQVLAATEERGIPWAFVFGNHDDMAFEWPLEWFGTSGIPGITDMHHYFRGMTRLELIRNDMKHVLSLSTMAPKALWPSMSNFAIPVVSSKDSSSVAAVLYFLDSGGGSYQEVISASQVQWFQTVSADLNPDAKIPEIVFWHIPSLTYKEVAPPQQSQIRSPCVGSINMEDVAPQAAEFGIMGLLSRRSSVKAVFTGHNHGLDWCCPYRHMWLCFARHTGYGGYGTWTRGARILDMVEEEAAFQLNSWITLENGMVTSRVKIVPSW